MSRRDDARTVAGSSTEGSRTVNRAMLAAAVVAVGAAGSTAALTPDPAPARSAAAYPSAMVVLGHSGATGFGSEPGHPFRDAPANSWATGTDPAVKSVYSRILARNPAIRGHNANLAQAGATLKELATQVRKAVTLKPKPQLVLVLVQIMENDIECDGGDESRYADFQAQLATSLGLLAKGLPKARILVVSKWGTLASYVKAVQSLGMGARLMHAGKGPCSIFAPKTGRVVPENLAYVRKITNGYHAQLAAACAQVATCRYDGGAASRITVTADDLSVRLQHLSVRGQAKLAAAIWSTLY
jgi:hypothetical protein